MGQLAGRIILLWGWRRYLVALVAGAVAVLAQAPFDFTAACFVSFPILIWLMDGATGDPSQGRLGRVWPAFLTGWWFGFGYFVAGLWWIGNALLVEADAFAWAIPLAVIALPAALAIFYGLACVVARLFWSGDVTRIVALALGFGIAEWLRGVVLTGFPWNAIGYAAMPVPVMMQSVSVVGLYGMNAIAVFVFAAPALLGTAKGRGLGLTLAALLAAAHVGFGYARLELAERTGSDRSVSVRLVQPSILQTRKWDATERDRIFATYLDLTRTPPAQTGARPAIVVWPETSVPFLFTDRPDALVAIGEALDDGQVLLAGAVRAEGEGGGAETRYYNSVVAISDRGEIIAAADKSHLVPFGEYLPMEDLLGSLGLEAIVDTPVSFSAGPAPQPMRLAGGLTVLPLICYEVIFPGETDAATGESDLIVNVTNDAWYGDTPGPYQHFRQAQVRAVETGRPMVRAANNGISGAVDAYGRVIDAFALDAVGAFDVTVRLGEPVLPPPVTSPVNGFAVLGFFAALILAGRSRRWFKPR